MYNHLKINLFYRSFLYDYLIGGVRSIKRLSL